MSQNASKSTQHGFCNAIFSSSPNNCNKENKTPAKKTKTSYVDVPNERRGRAMNTGKNESKCECNKNSRCAKHGQCLKDATPGQKGTSTKFSATNLRRSKSANTLQTDHIISGSIGFEDKIKTPIRPVSSRLSNEKTPVTHFCVSKPNKICTPISDVKMNLRSVRTPVKRYFSEHSLSQATPECFNPVQVEISSAKANERGGEEHTVCEGENSNLIVGVRVRPLNKKELEEPKIASIVEINGQNITVDCDSSQHTFMYDYCFISYLDQFNPGHSSQEDIFNSMVSPLVQNAFEGYNVCLFAYGQTGSGKSYSMMGTDLTKINSTALSEEAGIIPRFCQEIFMKISKNTHVTTTMEISYFEIYNEKIHDLLANTNNGVKRNPLKVREHPVFGPYVVDLSQHSVQSYQDLQSWLTVGNSQRATAATGMNEKSSRSHSIFSIILTQMQTQEQLEYMPMDASRRSKINLVDLAGSERLSHTCASGDRLREGVSINKSLLTLGKVIASLAENMNNRKRGFVPYRESVLTWLLKESLGGNSRTVMLATVSPANIHLEETLATLRYACQARAIVNRVRINEDPHDRLIRELKAEVQRLRGVREGYEKQLGVVPRRLLESIEPDSPVNEEIQEKQKEIDQLKNQLKKTEEQLATSQMTWQEKLQEAERRKDSELRYLRRCGIAVEIDLREKHKQPCLINLTADPMLSGTLLYLIPPGTVRIGKNNEAGDNSNRLDIVLDGPLVRQFHCSIENDSGKLSLLPEMDGDTFVNGQIVTGKVHLKHGDRLVIGGNHYFKVSNPHDENSNVQLSTQAIDFEFAHQEILRIQEAKLRAELEESKQKAIKELENAKREVELQLGSQKSSYEYKIKALGFSLEEQKQALEEINRKKKELELEKEILANEVETNNRIRRIQLEETSVNISPYKSNFLQELENILNEKTADVESALKMKMSNDAIKAGGITLHEMQILVREATERCREVGINYEFNQQRTVTEKAILQPVIRVRDKDNMKETFWEPMRFLDWIHRLRDHDLEDSIKELCDSKCEWDPYEDTDLFEDLSSSRISINMTPIKKQLNESLHQLSMDSSTLDQFNFTLDNQSSHSTTQEQENANACLIQIELATKTLCKLYQRYESEELKEAIIKSIDKVQSIIDGLRVTLEGKNTNRNKDGDNVSLNQSLNDTVIEKPDSTNFALSQKNVDVCVNKPNLKSNVPNGQNGNVSKSVRFIDAINRFNGKK